MKKLIRLITAGLLIFVILKLTTFGCAMKNYNFSNGNYNLQDIQLENRLKKHVYIISHEIGDRNIFNYENLNKTENYIINEFKAYGYEASFQEYAVENKKVRNIIAVRKGIKFPREVIIIGAHYDSCFNPGADDNASGVAGMLELARFMADKEVSRTIEFVAFVNEEPPFFKTENMGSRVYTRQARAVNKDIKAAVILEMIGYYGKMQRYPAIIGLFYPSIGNFIAVISNFKSSALAAKVSSFFKKHSEFPLEKTVLPTFIGGVDFSDHRSFWKNGYPAVMITDTAFFRNPNYHLSSDQWQDLNYKNMAFVVEGLSYSIIDVANK